MAPDSNTRVGGCVLRSSNAGIFELGLHRHEAAAELIAFADLDQPGVVFCAAFTEREQFLQHDRDLDAVGRRQRIELQRMLADRQFLVVRGAGDRPVDAGKFTAAFLVPFPDFRRRVFGFLRHCTDNPDEFSQASNAIETRFARHILGIV